MIHYARSAATHSSVQSGAWVFFLCLIAVKPFIDLLWDVKLGSISGFVINPPRLTGLLVFCVTALCIATLRRNKIFIAGQGLVIVFLGWLAFSMWLSYDRDLIRLTEVGNTLLRACDAYLLYILFSCLWTERRQVQTVVLVVWLSTLAVNIVSLFVWRTGEFNTNVTGTVERFAGLYNDAGGPSYNAALCFAFCVLTREIAKTQGTRVRFEKGLYYLTIAVCTGLLALSLTKSAFGIIFLFVMLWWGVYKKFSLLIVPLLCGAALLVYVESTQVQTRFSNEVRVFVKGDYSKKAMNSLGTGRYAVWSQLVTKYKRMSFERKMIGGGSNMGAHNQYLGYLLKAGVIGVMLFVAMIGTILWHAWKVQKRTRRPEVFFGFALLSIFCFLGIVGHPFEWTTLLWYVLIMVSTANARYATVADVEDEYVQHDDWEFEPTV